MHHLHKLAIKMADEDVVFVNSPLYDHLSEVGFTDFDAECLNFSPKVLGGSRDNARSSEHYDDSINRFLIQACVDWMRNIYGLIWRFLVPCAISNEISCYITYISLIKSSKLLTEHDLEFVYKFEQCREPDNHNEGSLSKYEDDIQTPVLWQESQSMFCTLRSNIFIGSIAVFAIIMTFITKHYQSSMIVLICLGSLFLFCKVYSLWWDNRINHNHNLLLLSNYLQVMDDLLVLIKKAVLFIQEKELLAHGHIIISPMAPVSRLESNSVLHGATIKQCLMLRKCIIIETKQYFGLLRNEIKELSSLDLFTDSKTLSWLDKHSAVQCLDEDVIGESMSTINELSLVELKRTFRCLVNQQSLLLCYAILKSCSVIDGLKLNKTVHNLEFIQNSFGSLLETGKECFDKINHCYRFHKVEIPKSVLDSEGMKSNRTKTRKNFSPLVLAVHSMNLHLQEVCKASVSIEEKLEEGGNIASIEGFVVEHHDEFEKGLVCLKSGLESVMSCWEESSHRLHEIFTANKKGKESCKERNTMDDNLADQVKDVQVLGIFEDIDIIQDQVFEGETSSQLMRDQKQASSSLSQQELFQEQKTREESRYLLQELKSVLATKDEEKMVGIPKALLVKKVDEMESSSILETHVLNVEPEENTSIMTKPTTEHDEKIGTSESEGNSSKYSTANFEIVHVQQELSSETLDSSQETERCSVVNPFASMVAAAALARNKACGVKEQSYEINGDIDTDGFCEETYSE